MSTPPYTTGKLKEGGALATRKQDFNSHVDGGSFNHGADSIMMNPVVVGMEAYTTVQSLLTQVANTSSSGVHGTTITIGNRSLPSVGDVNVGDPGINDLGAAISFVVNNIGTRFYSLANGGTIFIKTGRYNLSTPVILPAGISLVGDIGGTVIVIGYAANWSNPCITINRMSQAYSLYTGAGPRSIRQSTYTCIRDLVFANDPSSGEQVSPTLSQASLFSIVTGANVLFDNVSLLGRIGTNVVTKNFMSISSTRTAGYEPYTNVRMNNCYVDTVEQVININYDDLTHSIDQNSTVDITNCLFRVDSRATPTDMTGIVKIACSSSIHNNTFVRVSNNSSVAPMISFSQGSGYAPAGKPIIMNVSNNLGYTTDENGLLRNAGDVMMDAASRAVITNTPYNYIVLENNNTYYY